MMGEYQSISDAAWQACAASWVLTQGFADVETAYFMDLVQVIR